MPVVAEAFVGRIAELHQLDANLRAARNGSFRLVLIGGEAGVGKSRLVAEFLGRAAGVQKLVGACLPLESASLPYAPIIDALHGMLHAVPAGDLAAVAWPATPELTQLIPELRSEAEASAPDAPHDPAARQRFFDVLLGTVERLAQASPLVFVIEDVHWSDAATRDLLRFLVRGLRHASVLMILTVRTDEPGGRPSAAFTAELTRLASASRIELSRLSEAEVRELVKALAGQEPSPILVRAIYERGDGNPFLVEQLVMASAGGDALPPALAETIGLTLRGLSPAARSVLRVAAACGRRIDEALMTSASGLDRQMVRDGLSESMTEGILVPVSSDGSTQYQFRHALLREVVDAELLPADRRRLHAEVAAALEAAPDAAPAELAHHWEAAGEWQRAATAHLEAARSAEQVYAWVNAFRHYERARSLVEEHPATVAGDLDRAELLHRAAEAAYLAADYRAAAERGRQAISLVATHDAARSGELHERLRAYLWDAGDRRGAMASVEEALRLIPVAPPSPARARVLAQSAAVMMHTGRLDEAAERSAEALDVAQRTGSIPDIGQALAMLNWIRVLKGESEEGLAGLRQAVDAAEDAGDPMGIALGRALTAYLLDWMGRVAEAREVALAGHERLVELGLQRTYGGILLGYAALAAIHLGTWDEASRWVDLGLEYDEAGPAGHWLRINRGRLRTLQARWDEATADLLGARETELRSGGTEYGDQLLAAEAELAAWRGSVADARSAAEAIQRRPRGAPLGPAAVRAALFAAMAEADTAEAAALAGDRARQGTSRDRASTLSRLVGEGVNPVPYVREAPVWIALLDALDAEVRRAAAGDDAATWASIAERWESAGSPLMTAYAEYRQAVTILRDAGDRDHAYGLLARARARCDPLGAEALGQRIDRVAGDGGSTTAPSAGAGPETVAATGHLGRLSVHALGRLRIERDGQAINSLGGAKAGRRQAQALFAFLFDRGAQGVTKDEVIELIWSEVDLDQADTAFHRTLGGLRRVLDPSLSNPSVPGSDQPSRGLAIRFEQDRYVLDDRIVGFSDVRAFDAAVDTARASSDPAARRAALEKARRLYRGDYFDDCPHFGDSAEVEPTRSRLRDRMATVLVMLAELEEEGGELRAAAELYRAALNVSGGQDAMAAEGLARLGALRVHLRVVDG